MEFMKFGYRPEKCGAYLKRDSYCAIIYGGGIGTRGSSTTSRCPVYSGGECVISSYHFNERRRFPGLLDALSYTAGSKRLGLYSRVRKELREG